MGNEQQVSEVKEGVNAPSGASGDSPTSVETKGNEQTGTQSVKPVAQSPSQEKSESIPFGDKRHPEYKRFKELSESARSSKAEAEQFRKEIAELRGFRDAMLAQQNRQGQQQLTQEQESALEQIFSMALRSDKVSKMIAQKYGLDRLDEVHKGFSSFKENWEGQQYEAEMKDVLKSAKDLGLDQDEVEEELREHVTNHPFFAEKNYFKGGVWAAFRDKYWDRRGELQERAENLKKIEERERLKSGQTQTPADTTTKADAALPKDGVARNVEIIRRAGGMDKFPMFR